MFSRFTTTCIAACCLIVMFSGCSQNPSTTTPGTTPEFRDGAGVAGEMCWGLWDVTIDGETGSIEMVPIRTAEFTANVVRFLQPPIAPIEFVTIQLNSPESDIMNGLITMDITLRHPFPGKTIFRGFDVRGIIMAEGGRTGIHDSGVKFAAPGQMKMVNPDGYSRWWNQAEFTTYGTVFGYTEGHFAKAGFTATSTVNPYKLHTPSLKPTQPIYQLDPTTRATFPSVDGYAKRQYRLQFNKTQFPIYRFKYAVSASWSLPNPAYAPNYPAQAFDLLANCQEPYLVRVPEYVEIPYYVDEWVAGGDLEFLLTVGDWQATGGNVLNEISHVWLESPTLFDAPVDVRNTMEFVESTTPTQATYRIRIEDMMPDGLENQQLLITVESASPNTFEPQIQGDTSKFKWPTAPLAAYLLCDVPVTNLTPEGDYAYVYFLPDWCGTMRLQCTENGGDNQILMKNLISQNIEGSYNDYTHVQIWEGKTNVMGQTIEAFQATCTSLGYSLSRTQNDYFDATGSRVVIIIGLNTSDLPPDPPYTEEEAHAMQEFIDNGGILCIMCEASQYFPDQAYDQLFGWLGMLMQYGGGATPEYDDGYTDNITWHWLTEDVDLYHYYTCGEWITQDPHVLTLISTEVDEKLVLVYPLPLN